jgi:beta-1,4-mannooligosaccharide/beta-1,4-mannosyl-N-acetylglucosamine phosphorylase
MKIHTNPLPGIPWQPRPAGNSDLMWRYDANPVIGRRPLPRVTGIYNSAVVPWRGGFAGVFRTEGMDRIPHLHVGRSADGFTFVFEQNPIAFRHENGAAGIGQMEYAYDPRVTEIEGIHYVTWCNGYHGPTIGIARTTDFETFGQLENAFLPYNRNGVLFPRKISGNYIILSRPLRHRSHALRGHFYERKSRHDSLGPSPPRHRQGRPLVAGRQDRRRPLAHRNG